MDPAGFTIAYAPRIPFRSASEIQPFQRDVLSRMRRQPSPGWPLARFLAVRRENDDSSELIPSASNRQDICERYTTTCDQLDRPSAGLLALCRDTAGVQNRSFAVKMLFQKPLTRTFGMVPSVPSCRAIGPEWQVNAMEKLIEFYQMVCLNKAVLSGTERTAIRRARRALRTFERAMKGLNKTSTEAPFASENSVGMAI